MVFERGSPSGKCTLRLLTARQLVARIGPTMENPKISLFVPESQDGVDAHGATCWDIASSEGNSSEQQDYASEDQRIRRAHAEQHAAHQARDGQGYENSDEFASKGELGSL